MREGEARREREALLIHPFLAAENTAAVRATGLLPLLVRFTEETLSSPKIVADNHLFGSWLVRNLGEERKSMRKREREREREELRESERERQRERQRERERERERGRGTKLRCVDTCPLSHMIRVFCPLRACSRQRLTRSQCSSLLVCSTLLRLVRRLLTLGKAFV